jgi:hypothetical protein
MNHRIRFGITGILKVTIWLAIACFVVRVATRVTAAVPIGPGNIPYIAAASVFVLAPFAAVGAIFNRMDAGFLWGLVFIVVTAALLRGL